MGFTFKLNRSHFDKWRKVDNGNLLTYVHDESGSALQFTHARYKGTNKLELPPEKLIHLATNAIEKVRNPRDTYSATGDCDFGKFGMVRLKGDEPAYFQAWVLWNERDQIIYVTYVASQVDARESQEAHQIAMMTGYE